MSKIIEAKAVISAADQTGKTFDNIAKKIEGVAKAANSFKGMTPFAKTGWGQGFDKELDRLKATASELQVIQKSWQSFNNILGSGGPMAASKAIGALDMWKRQTLSNLREVKAATEAAEGSTVRYMKNAARFALTAAGVGYGAYEVGRGVRATVRTAAERQRELTRYGLAGLTPAEQASATARADEISGRLPNVSRTDVLEHIRQLRARLGSFDHAMGSVEDLTRAQTVLKTLGHGDSSEDLEKLVLALESQGLGGNPEKFRSYLSAFVKAKSLFPDLRGEDFRQYMQRAAVSKYGLSDDYLKTVAPTMMQHEGASQFGTMQASAFSALVGGRQTKEAKAAMARFGLIGNGKLLDEKGFIANPYDWAVNRLQPALAKRGIKLDEEHRGDVVAAVTQMFSNRKVGEFFASMLVNQGIVAKDRENLRRAAGIEGADYARRNDPFSASEALVTQMKDAGTALIKLQPLVDSLNYLTDKVAKGTSYFDQAGSAEKTGFLGLGGAGAIGGLLAARMGYQWFTGTAALSGSAAQLSAAAVALDAAAAKLAGGGVVDKVSTAAATGGAAVVGGIAAGVGVIGGGLSYLSAKSVWGNPRGYGAGSGNMMLGAMGGDYSLGGEIARQYATKYPFPEGDFTFGADRRFHQFGNANEFHAASPRRDLLGMPGFAVQPDAMQYKELQVQLVGSAEVHGEATITVKVEATSDLLRAAEMAKEAVKLVGGLQANGPGSNGRTSPDAQPGAGGRGLSAMPY